MTSISIHRQSRAEFPAGTVEEVAEELRTALERGWL
jgi:hypothetical protein